MVLVLYVLYRYIRILVVQVGILGLSGSLISLLYVYEYFEQIHYSGSTQYKITSARHRSTTLGLISFNNYIYVNLEILCISVVMMR